MARLSEARYYMEGEMSVSTSVSNRLLPREIRAPTLTAIIEKTIGSLAVLRARLDAWSDYRQFIALLIRADAVLASDLHCSEADLLNLLAYEAGGAARNSISSIRPSLNYVKSLEWALTSALEQKTAFRIDNIKYIHRELTQLFAVRGAPGEFRQHHGPARQGDAETEFKPVEIEQTMADIQDFLEHPPAIPLILRLGLIYGQMEIVVPFSYGSRAVARILVQMMLAREGFPEIPMAWSFGGAYQLDAEISELRRTGDWENWLAYFLSRFAHSIHAMSSAVSAVEDLRCRWQNALSVRKDSSARSVIDILMVKPVLTVTDLQRLQSIKFQTANMALSRLLQQNIVSILPIGQAVKRNRIFLAAEVIHSVFTALQN